MKIKKIMLKFLRIIVIRGIDVLILMWYNISYKYLMK